MAKLKLQYLVALLAAVHEVPGRDHAAAAVRCDLGRALFSSASKHGERYLVGDGHVVVDLPEYFALCECVVPGLHRVGVTAGSQVTDL